MKFKLLSLSLLLALSGAACAATVTVTNIDFADTNPIVNSSGTIYGVGTGFVAIGVFSITDAQIAGATSAATLVSAFSQFGSSSTFGSGFNVAGTYQFETTAAILSGSPYTGSIYTVIGNASTLAASTEFFIYKNGVSFNPDPAPSGPALVNDGNGTVILGQFDVFDTSIGAGPLNAYNTVKLVPEPSVALLGAIGGLALLRRRRN